MTAMDVIVSAAWYTYTYRPLKVELFIMITISDNPVHNSHVTFILHDQATHILSMILIICGGTYNL